MAATRNRGGLSRARRGLKWHKLAGALSPLHPRSPTADKWGTSPRNRPRFRRRSGGRPRMTHLQAWPSDRDEVCTARPPLAVRARRSGELRAEALGTPPHAGQGRMPRRDAFVETAPPARDVALRLILAEDSNPIPPQPHCCARGSLHYGPQAPHYQSLPSAGAFQIRAICRREGGRL